MVAHQIWLLDTFISCFGIFFWREVIKLMNGFYNKKSVFYFMRVNFPGGVENEQNLSAYPYRERGMSSR